MKVISMTEVAEIKSHQLTSKKPSDSSAESPEHWDWKGMTEIREIMMAAWDPANQGQKPS